MIDIDVLLKRRKVNIEQLIPFGFSKDQNGYSYSADLLDGQFEMKVVITKSGNLSTEVIDCSTKESFMLHLVPSAMGAFVGRVRKEYESVLTMITETCFITDIFKTRDAKQIIQYAKENYQSELEFLLEFLWKRFPDNAIFRRQDNAKWYAALLIVQKKKLGLDGDDFIEILDLRAEPEDITALVDGKKYFPGYLFRDII